MDDGLRGAKSGDASSTGAASVADHFGETSTGSGEQPFAGDFQPAADRRGLALRIYFVRDRHVAAQKLRKPNQRFNLTQHWTKTPRNRVRSVRPQPIRVLWRRAPTLMHSSAIARLCREAACGSLARPAAAA